MYIQTTKYMEEAWGAKVPVYESELIVDKYEVEDLIMDQLFDDETYPGDWKFYFTDNYTEEEIEIDASDYIDTDLLPDYLDDVKEGEIDLAKLYALANVWSPYERMKGMDKDES